MIVGVIPIQPVDVFDGLFERTIDLLKEFDFVDTDGSKDMLDAGDGRLADADTRHIGRLDQA